MPYNWIMENSSWNTTKLEYQNNKQKQRILEALHIRDIQPKLYRIHFETSANGMHFEKINKNM